MASIQASRRAARKSKAFNFITLPKWLERNARTGERKKFTAPEVLRGHFPADEKYTESRILKLPFEK
jgi:hypothetical protein